MMTTAMTMTTTIVMSGHEDDVKQGIIIKWPPSRWQTWLINTYTWSTGVIFCVIPFPLPVNVC